MIDVTESTANLLNENKTKTTVKKAKVNRLHRNKILFGLKIHCWKQNWKKFTKSSCKLRWLFWVQQNDFLKIQEIGSNFWNSLVHSRKGITVCLSFSTVWEVNKKVLLLFWKTRFSAFFLERDTKNINLGYPILISKTILFQMITKQLAQQK